MGGAYNNGVAHLTWMNENSRKCNSEIRPLRDHFGITNEYDI